MIDSNAYVGIPFLAGGRTRAGVDCWGLVRLVLGDHVPDFEGDPTDTATNEKLFLAAIMAGVWRRCEQPREGDIIVIRVSGRAAHFGVAVEGTRFLHSMFGRQTTVEDYTSPKWSERVLGFWRYAGDR